MSKYIYTKFLEHLDSKKIIIKIDTKSLKEDGDYIFLAYYGKIVVGTLRLEILYDAYTYEFEGLISEELYNEMFTDDTIVKIESLSVEKQYRNNHVANNLMSFSLKYIKEQGYNQFYLNASPQYDSSLQLPNLITFYEKFGFEVFLHQGNNALMYYINKNINESKTKKPMTNAYQYSKMLKRKGYTVIDGGFNIQVLMRGDGDELDRTFDIVVPDYSDALKQNRIDIKNGDDVDVLKAYHFDYDDVATIAYNNYTHESRELFYSEIDDVLIDLNKKS